MWLTIRFAEMSAEGIGLAIGFASLFITMVGLAVAGGTAYGKLFTQSANTATKLDKIDEDNRSSHKEIFDCQKETDIKVGAIEQHLRDMNGKLIHNGEEHRDIIARVSVLERERNRA